MDRALFVPSTKNNKSASKNECCIFDYYYCRHFRTKHYTKNVYRKSRNKRNLSFFIPYGAFFNDVLYCYLKEHRLESGDYSVFYRLCLVICSLFTVWLVSCCKRAFVSFVAYDFIFAYDSTFYGIIFLKEPISICFVIGLLLLAISLFLVNKKNDKCPVKPKWLLFVFLSFVGNGLCSTVQKMQQLAFAGEYKNEFMIISLAIVFLILGAATLLTNKGNLKENLYYARFTAASAGAMNGIVNLLVMVLSGMIPVSVMFPLISAGGIIVTYIISKAFYKEKLTKTQLAGFLTGLASIVFLNF